MADLINIEVAYATKQQQKILALSVPLDSTVMQVILQSGITKFFPDLTITDDTKIGIFGKIIDQNSYKLQNDDRIEIYRKLSKTPNERRLERAKKNS